MGRTRNTTEGFKNAYKKTGAFAVAPLAFSIDLIRQKGHGDYDFSGVTRLVGWLSLPFTTFATIFTFSAGGLGMAGISIVAAGAIPTAYLADRFDPEQMTSKNTDEVSSSPKIKQSGSKNIFTQLEKNSGNSIKTYTLEDELNTTRPILPSSQVSLDYQHPLVDEQREIVNKRINSR